MKKILVLALILSALVSVASAQSPAGNTPTTTQVTCGNSATLLKAATPSVDPSPWGRLSITFQKIDSGASVFIGPRSDIAISNGIGLFSQGQAITIDKSSGRVAWYCISTTGSTTIAVLEEK